MQRSRRHSVAKVFQVVNCSWLAKYALYKGNRKGRFLLPGLSHWHGGWYRCYGGLSGLVSLSQGERRRRDDAAIKTYRLQLDTR